MAWAELRQRWAAGAWVALAGPGEEPPPLPGAPVLPPGPGVVLGSGGSTGARRWCVQPLAHLEASARATATWLEAGGVDPSACLHLNPLPQHHVSGLLPRLRAGQWGCEHRALAPALMRDPAGLAAAVALPRARPALLSLVPTQLERLLADPAGLAWLRRLAVIWVGGAALPAELAGRARRAQVRLAPCYGATETAAMVTALAPEAFLAGVEGCGAALADVELRLEPATTALELRTARLSPGYLEAGRLVPLPRTADGWWRSADGAALGPAGVQLLGRLDGAISSGGETVFPEQVERRLWARCRAAGLPVTALLLLAEPDPTWGARLVALVRLEAGAVAAATLGALRALAAPLPASQRPRRWLFCPDLAPSPLGKWERQRWRAWLAHQADCGR